MIAMFGVCFIALMVALVGVVWWCFYNMIGDTCNRIIDDIEQREKDE